MRPYIGPTPGLLPSRPSLLRILLATTLFALLTAGLVGCDSKAWVNPGELVDPDKSNILRRDGTARPRVQTILAELDLGVQRDAEAFSGARDVQARDLVAPEEDYRLRPGDVVRVSIPELNPGGVPYVEALEVSQSGRLTLPRLTTPVPAAGLTDAEAADAIANQYVAEQQFNNRDAISVSLLVVQPNGRAYNITGNVGMPGRYIITQPDYRMLDALTQARGTTDPMFNSDFAYVVRNNRPTTRPPQNPPQGQPDNLDPLRPRSALEPVLDEPVYASVQGTANRPQGNQPQGGGSGFQFDAPQRPADVEVIRVPLRELLKGELQYNVVVRSDDTIIVPPPRVGEYYVYGHVLAPGAFQILPGRQLTVKQAITTARGLDEVAIPSRTQLVRRVGDQDVFVRIDLSKIFVGQEPDLYLQPNDMIMVGTNIPAPFIAAFRNAFRVTYGFGFLYDRNFAVDRADQRF